MVAGRSPERQRRGIGDVRPRRRHDQHLIGQRLEIGPEMHRALQRQNAPALPARRPDGAGSPDRPPACGARTTATATPGARKRTQQGHRPEIHAVAAIHRPGRGEPAVAQSDAPPSRPTAARTPAGPWRPPSARPRRIAPSPGRVRARPPPRDRTSSASSAPSARAAISAARRPVVSALPPPPGLSCVSARMIGRPPVARCACATASSGRPEPAGEARLGCGEGGGQPVDRRPRSPIGRPP